MNPLKIMITLKTTTGILKYPFALPTNGVSEEQTTSRTINPPSQTG
jgi:hypothetical protein